MTSTTLTSALSCNEITTLADEIIGGQRQCSAAEARAMLDLDLSSAEGQRLLQEAGRVREHFLGNVVQACSILNAKAGNCTENCSYCTQAAGVEHIDYEKHKWMDDDGIAEAAESAADNGAKALGLVAAWKGVKEGSQLDMVCESVKKLSQNGAVRADVNLGILESQTCADRLKEAGAMVYGHNLETARSFFDETCSSHSFEERLQTIEFIRNAGMKLCSGGIFGMGEDKDQRVEFAEQLRFIAPEMIPINFLNPVEGTALEDKATVPPDEALLTLAMLRFFLPDRNIMVAGGKEVTFGDRLAEVFSTGINAVMVGNYLTTMGTTPDFWQQAAQQHGMRMVAESDQDGCGESCGCH